MGWKSRLIDIAIIGPLQYGAALLETWLLRQFIHDTMIRDVAIAVCTLAIIVAVPLLVIKGSWRTKRTGTPPKSQASPGWLEEIAEQDRNQLRSRVFVIDKSFAMEFDRANPYITFSFSIINASVFTIELVSIDGHMRTVGEIMKDAPEFVGSVGVGSRIERLANTILEVRQFLLPGAVERIKEQRPPGSTINFNFNQVGIWVTIVGDDPATQHQVSLGNPQFTVPPQ